MCGAYKQKSSYSVEPTNGRDFGLYNIGDVCLGVVLPRMRITSFKLQASDVCSSKDAICEISCEGGSYAQTKQTYVRS